MKFKLLEAGSCTHPAATVKRTWSLERMRFPALVGMFEHPRDGVFLFDTGYSSRVLTEMRRFPERIYGWITPVTLRPEETVVAQLEALGIGCDDVTRIFVSHFHADHVGALADFPRARYEFLAEAWNGLRGKGRIAALKRGFLPGLLPVDFEQRARSIDAGSLVPLPPECSPFERGVDLCGDGSILGIPLPGHARGQMGLYFHAAEGDARFLVADSAWTGEALTKRQLPLPIARLLFDDWAAYGRTLRQLAEMEQARGDLCMLPSHCSAAQAVCDRLDASRPTS